MSQFEVPKKDYRTRLYMMSEAKTITLAGMRKRIQRANKKAGIIASIGRPPKTQTFECKQDKDDEGVYNCEEITKDIKALEAKPIKKPKKFNPKKDFAKAQRARKPPRHKSINSELQQQFNEQQRAKEQAYALQLEQLRGQGQDKELDKINRDIDRQNVRLGFQGVSNVLAEQEQNIGKLSDLAKKYLPHEFDNRGYKRPKQNADNIGLILNPRQALDEPDVFEDPEQSQMLTIDDPQTASEDARFDKLMKESADLIGKSYDEPTSSQKNINEPVIEDTPFQSVTSYQGLDPIIEEVEESAEPVEEVVDTDEDDDIEADVPSLSERPFMFLESVPPKNNALFYLPKQLKELPTEDKKTLFMSLGVRSDSAYTALRKERALV